MGASEAPKTKKTAHGRRRKQADRRRQDMDGRAAGTGAEGLTAQAHACIALQCALLCCC